MIVPETVKKYIWFQRTHLRDMKNIEEAYAKDMESEFADISAFLPEKADYIVDIGCGLAGIDVLLQGHYPNAHFFLIDKDGVSSKVVYGFRKTAAYYNSFEASRLLLKANSVDTTRFSFFTPTRFLTLESGFVDLVISLYSWGYHYSLKEYLHHVYRVLKPGGKVIVDIRYGVGEDKVVESSKLICVSRSEVSNKKQRTLLIKEIK